MVLMILIRPAARAGLYVATVNGQELLQASREPLLEGARVLKAMGYPDDAGVVMRRSIDGPDQLRSTIGAAAKLIVAEGNGDRPPGFIQYKAFDAHHLLAPDEHGGAL